MKPSELTTRMESYLALRRAMGFPMKFQEPRLRDFVAFVEAEGAGGPITANWRSNGRVLRRAGPDYGRAASAWLADFC